MQSVENDIVALNAQLDATNSALSTLFSPQQTNQEKAFENYSKSADKVQEAGNNFLKHTDAMATSGADYFSEWRKQGDSYTNPQIRAISEERRAELSSAFTRIAQASVGLRSSLQTYLVDIKDIRTYLSTDLTPKGVEAMKPTADKAMADGATLKLQIEPVLLAVTEARRQLSPNAAPVTQ